MKRDKIRRAVLWYAKKTKMLETLEEAFPASLKMADLLRYGLHYIVITIMIVFTNTITNTRPNATATTTYLFM